MNSITIKKKHIDYVFTENGGRGLIQLEEIMKLMEYADSQADPLTSTKQT